jgi:hypothetical protein
MWFLSAIVLTQHIAFLRKSSCLKKFVILKKQRAVSNAHAKNHPKPSYIIGVIGLPFLVAFGEFLL